MTLFFRKPLFFLLLSLLTLTLVHCTKEKKPPTSENNTLHLNLSDDPVSLDPRVVRSLKDLTLVKQLFEGLTRLDAQGIPQLALAEKIEISDDQLTYTFYLRESCWSNGEKVTALDFEHAWKSVLNPTFRSDYAYMLYPLKNAKEAKSGTCSLNEIGVKATGEFILQAALECPTPYFLELTAFPTYYAVNKKTDAERTDWANPPGLSFISNGPFCLKEWHPQREIQLQKNPLYWDAQSVALKEIDFSMIQDSNTENLLFNSQELDWLGQPISQPISAENYAQLKEANLLGSYKIAGTFWFKYNTEKAPFNNVKLRKAFAYAMNREEIITHILQGSQSIACGLLPPSMALKERNLFQDHDCEYARLLFEEGCIEMGWGADNFPPISLYYVTSERNRKIVQTVQQQWKSALGIWVELVGMESHVFRSLVREGLYQIGTSDWIADYNDPLAFLELFKYRNDEASSNGMNDTYWHNEKYTSLLNRSLLAQDKEARAALLLAAETILMEEMPVAPVYHYSFDYAKKPYVNGVILSPLGIADFKHTQLLR